jgi:hypothetical protein
MNAQICCPVAELRQYTLVPDGREVLIALFERELIEIQESTGMTVIGQFRDLNNADRFGTRTACGRNEREDANVFVWFARFADCKAYEESAAAVAGSMRQKRSYAKTLRAHQAAIRGVAACADRPVAPVSFV